MIIGIFSDIHGNIYAFEKIWKALRVEACDLYLFLGDICGYYYYQNEIIEMLSEERNIISVVGNHDLLFLKALKNNRLENTYAERYGKSSTILKETIRPKSLKFLKEMPGRCFIKKYNIVALHGSPWDHLNGYVYPTDSITRFQGLSYSFVLLGHTHYPMDRSIGRIRIINPGSCGQPRDCDRPSYAVLDLEHGTCKIRRVTYNRSSLAKDIIKHRESNRYLTDVLKRK